MSIDAFFQDIDARWPDVDAIKIPLRLIGATALMLQADYERGTKDSDVFETEAITAIKPRLLALAGAGTPLHQKHRMYLDVVGNGVPFLPGASVWHPQVELNRSLRKFEIAVLDVVDVVVTKLKRFHSNDQSDVQAMIERGLVPHDRLLSRFLSAVDHFQYDARAEEELPRYVRNLNRVERDMLGVPETAIELPE
ncbi:MAG: DUF6036 family nucleotidyltransferase [Byssovorax sp.]